MTSHQPAILVIGHHFVVASNRAMWNMLPMVSDSQVDIVCPDRWRSNLFDLYRFKYTPQFDCYTRNLFPLPVYANGRGSFYFYQLFQFWRILWRQQYQHIFIAQEAWSLALFQLLIFKFLSPNWRAKIHVVVNENLKRRRWLGLIEWIFSFHIERFWGCSKECQDVLRWKGIRRPFSLLPFSIDESQYQSLPARNRQVAGKNPFIIGFLGRLTASKGLQDLAQAISILKQKQIPVKLKIAGSGELSDELLKAGATMLGPIPHQEAYKFYADIDLFVLPSRTTARWQEQFGRVLVEAAAAGVPVIGSSSGAIPEVLAQMGMGKEHVFKEKNAMDLAEKILYLYQNLASNLLVERLDAAQALALSRFGHTAVARSVNQELL
jgi:glycosyltransferase involved in cell wall biosynthesis